MRILRSIAASCLMAASVAGCQKSEPENGSGQVQVLQLDPDSSAAAAKPEGIDWFEGGLEAAFAKARVEDKPVLLYWGAAWCPPCHQLKAKVFTQRQFIDKTKLFVPVSLDGDDPGAQKWSETFKVFGYPTILVLRADRSEVVRLAGDTDLNRYAAVLDIALHEMQPLENVIASVKQSTGPLSLDVCRRLAYISHVSKDNREEAGGETGLTMEQAYEAAARAAKDPLRGLDPQQVIERCPSEARLERARLTAMRVRTVMFAEAEHLDAMLTGKKPATPRLKEAMRALLGLMDDRDIAIAVADMMVLDEKIFTAARRMGAMDEGELNALHQRWVEARDAEADDPSLSTERQLFGFQRRLLKAKEQNPQGPIPEKLVDEAHRRVDAALGSTPPSAPERVTVVTAALGILYLLEDLDRVRAVLEKETAVAASPYYYMTKLAELEEKQGHEDAALDWFRRAYKASTGRDTRFSWGVDYVDALIRLSPQNEAAVLDAAMEVLGELDGPDRLHGRPLATLRGFADSLRKWNSAGTHDQAISAIRSRVVGICAQIPSTESASRKRCAEFLAQKA